MDNIVWQITVHSKAPMRKFLVSDNGAQTLNEIIENLQMGGFQIDNIQALMNTTILS